MDLFPKLHRSYIISAKSLRDNGGVGMFPAEQINEQTQFIMKFVLTIKLCFLPVLDARTRLKLKI
jgi:hypothetical protein